MHMFIIIHINFQKKSRLFIVTRLFLKKIYDISKIQRQSIAFGHWSLKIARKTLISRGNMRDEKLSGDLYKNERVPDLYFRRWKIEKHTSCISQSPKLLRDSATELRACSVFPLHLGLQRFETFYDLTSLAHSAFLTSYFLASYLSWTWRK